MVGHIDIVLFDTQKLYTVCIKKYQLEEEYMQRYVTFSDYMPNPV